MNATATFTGYKTKSDAKRGFGRKFKDAYSVDDYLDQMDGKWGFAVEGDKPVPVSRTAKQVEALLGDNQPVIKSVFPASPFGASAPAATPKVDAELNAALSQHHEDGSDVVQHDAFSAFATSQLTSRPTTNTEPRATSTASNSRVERNREEANGVKRPSAGTLCAQVWDIATQLSNGDEKPSTKIAKLNEVVKAAVAKGINQYTARTQYARWRVFHGITGRNA